MDQLGTLTGDRVPGFIVTQWSNHQGDTVQGFTVIHMSSQCIIYFRIIS